MLESEATRDDLPIVQDIRLHYSSFITHLIKHSPGNAHTSHISFTLQDENVRGI